jgi:hypothetical protein
MTVGELRKELDGVDDDIAVKTADGLDITLSWGARIVFIVDHEDCNSADCCSEKIDIDDGSWLCTGCRLLYPVSVRACAVCSSKRSS